MVIKKFGFTQKKPYGYQEIDEVKRLLFKEKIAPYVPENIVYIDEFGMHSREDYSYGGNAKGQRFYALKSGRRQGRINTIARAYCNSQLLAPFTVEGSCNRTVFETKARNLFNPNAKIGTNSDCR